MQYLISSPPNPNLDKLLEYAKTLGIEVLPLPTPTKAKDFSFDSLRVTLSAETNEAIDEEMKQIHAEWERDI